MIQKGTEIKISRIKTKVDSLTSVVASLKNNHLVSSSCADILEKTVADAPHNVIKGCH